MAHRFVISLMFVALTLLLTGASFANAIPSIVVFGPSTSGSFSISSTTITFSGISGPALFVGSVGTFSLADNTLSMPSGNGGKNFFKQPDATLFTVDIGSDSLAGWLSLDFVQTINSQHAFFDGTYSITSATSGFSNAGFPVGAVTDLNFVTDNSGGITILSDGEIPSVPEPGTIALVGSGLLGAAGLLRRKS